MCRPAWVANRRFSNAKYASNRGLVMTLRHAMAFFQPVLPLNKLCLIGSTCTVCTLPCHVFSWEWTMSNPLLVCHQVAVAYQSWFNQRERRNGAETRW